MMILLIFHGAQPNSDWIEETTTPTPRTLPASCMVEGCRGKVSGKLVFDKHMVCGNCKHVDCTFAALNVVGLIGAQINVSLMRLISENLIFMNDSFNFTCFLSAALGK